MTFSQIFNNVPIYVWIGFGVALVAVVALYIVRQKKAGNFLAEHPDAATIVIDQHPAQGRTIAVHSVNGEPAVTFTKGTQIAFYCVPGRIVVSATFSEQSQKLTKTVLKRYGPKDVTLTIEPAGNYAFGWDLDTQNFTLTRR